MIEQRPSSSPAVAGPMDLGAIFDGAFTVYRSHFWTIVGSIAVMVVPVALARGLAGEGTNGNPLLVVSLGLEVFVSLLTPAVAAIVVGDMALGRSITVGSVWRRMGRVILPLIATMVMVMAAVIGSAALGGFPAVLVYVWFAFAAQVVVLEDTRYGRAMGRSRQLVKHSWWRVFGNPSACAGAGGRRHLDADPGGHRAGRIERAGERDHHLRGVAAGGTRGCADARFCTSTCGCATTARTSWPPSKNCKCSVSEVP